MKSLPPSSPARLGLSARQRWIFRVLALLSPLLLLAMLEIFLRLAGQGYPTDFFLRQRLAGREVLTDNRQFGWRFFPPEMARTPQPVVFSARKEPGTTRIFVLGESAAMGDPEPAFGLPRMLQAMLELRFPSNKFEVINAAMTAINSHVLREVARDCADLDGDVWIVYAGNNEVVGPFGGGTVLGRQVPGRWFIRASLWLKQFRCGQWLTARRSGPAGEWGGMEMFLRQQVRHDDPRMARVYEHFQANLSDIVQSGVQAGARVVLSTVAVNLPDSPPFASLHHLSFPESGLAGWERLLAEGAGQQQAGQWTNAYQRFLALQQQNLEDTHAGLAWHLGRCELALGLNGGGVAHLNQARNWDTLRFRADDRINGTIRRLGTNSGPTVTLADSERRLAVGRPFGLAGADDFYEHVHFTFQGTYRLAAGLLEDVVRALPQGKLDPARTGIPTEADCARRLAWTDWEQLQVFGEVRKRLQQPPFSTQFGHEERDRHWQERIAALERGLTEDNFPRVLARYEAALQAAPDDWVLHENLAKLLESNGRIQPALQRWQEVLRRMPHDPEVHFHLGNLLESDGRRAEAMVHFREALRLNPRLAEARNGLALALMNSGQTEAAERELRTALRLHPRLALVRVNLGQLLGQTGRTNEALGQYEEALRLDPNSAAAHVNLGKLHNRLGDRAAALRHYREAVRLEPNSAVARYNLALALPPEEAAAALEELTAAVRIRPGFAEARLALALQLIKARRPAEAEPHLAEAVKLQPNSPDAHFNYGVWLANSRRFTEAVREFSATLRLEPENARAREFLRKAEAMSGP